MRTKTCIQCGNDLPIDEFYASNKTVDGRRNRCKVCFNKKATEYRKSKFGLITQIYSQQKTSSKIRGHHLPNYTKQELEDWLFEQQKFHDLYDKWVKSGYKKELAPSCDRIDSKKSYYFDNLQLLTFEENHFNENIEMRKGHIGRAKPVIGINLRTGYKVSFISASEAGRQLKLHKNHIIACCNEVRKTTGGYSFTYK